MGTRLSLSLCPFFLHSCVNRDSASCPRGCADGRAARYVMMRNRKRRGGVAVRRTALLRPTLHMTPTCSRLSLSTAQHRTTRSSISVEEGVLITSFLFAHAQASELQ